ncbi:Inositol-tetrakisphosphate 1-kinase 1 [Capsicum annuum]|uniref:Inositol-tetrakisphosphate 1-kinase n=1 Tax=Capsicum annuum TaxID=4072 RepID=A0A1U8FY69_CAPAN|nr:inositol-tetrakisphosphate 1-kinase 1 [Capsicum annuum]KAF3641167.1 Inositol-tetrakisphosphate 1-kinase 1 [Capsicum annuum]KAF3663836.1 Inositol-tetrakisphosphate 1-kinase 1 [Capsicum annuum]PHT87691.1 Inositol-tetrakisphosphate 1-kinase 1 [Capsicum annuum]
MWESVAGKRFRIGYALSPQKISTFMKHSLIIHARDRGVDFIQIDLTKPLIEQGPFDCVIHKLYDAEWKKQLEEFSLKSPTTFIIDPLNAIDKLQNRVTMLEFVNELKIQNLGTPLQVFVSDESSEALQDAMTREGLKFPVIAKPLIADGAANSHQMSLVLNQNGLTKLDPPIVLQEFVNHGGVIFKVYVAGDHVKCVKRKSLPDINEEKLNTSSSENLISFSRISNFAPQNQSDRESYAEMVEAMEMPPLSFVNEVASRMRDALKLRLFNFDMLRDSRIGTRYLLVDINYFPGYAKAPEFETMLTDFFIDIAHKKRSRESGNLDQMENKMMEADSNGNDL